jgi:glycosyltransferase involved in cell wall biosynthesis
MDTAGTETWLANMVKRVDRKDVAADFLVYEPQSGAYDAELIERGCRIYKIANPRRAPGFGARLCEILRRAPRYDVIHSHVDHYGGFIALWGRLAGIQTRIVHSHNTGYADKEDSLGRSLYLAGMRCSIHLNATECLAASDDAAAWMYGSRWREDARCRVLPCGVDLSSFGKCEDAARVRDELRISQGALVVGHVGRFHLQKNHSFFVKVADCVARTIPNAVFVLVGGGPLQSAIQNEVRQRGLEAHFRFLGVRRDIARLLGAMDIFMFPSLFEGLGLVLIEAQAAGLPCVISDRVPQEADVVPGLVKRLPLTIPPEGWSSVIEQIRPRFPHEREAALKVVERSKFNITTSADKLMELYTSAANRRNFS